MSEAGAAKRSVDIGTFAPLREPVFRNIWAASLFSNLAQLVLGVGAAWEMTQLTTSASMVAAVQTALMVPLMLCAVPAGAMADMFDRRKIALFGLGFSVIGAAILTALAYLGLLSAWVILIFCVVIGTGVAVFSPAWQASIREQVAPEQLPAAIGLGSISFNIARSFGPALGGAIVLAWGAKAAFGLTTVAYVPLFIAFLMWKRVHIASRLPPERIDRAVLSGFRYAFYSPPIRGALVRVLIFGLGTASYVALGPLIAKDLLQGNASTYGLLLGAGGVGAIIGALAIQPLRRWIGTEHTLRWAAVVSASALALMGMSESVWLTTAAFFVIGAGNILTVSLLNVVVQIAAPRWVTARALSLYTSALTGGIAIGAIFWGGIATAWSIEFAMVMSAAAILLVGAAGLLMPARDDSDTGNISDVALMSHEPDVALEITSRSGPIEIEIDYNVDPADAREFYAVMLQVQSVRQRNGGSRWSLSRAIGDPCAWTERFECPTWGDYLRLRDRKTPADQEVHERAEKYHRPSEGQRIRRQLVRPFGSVRWRAETPDPRQDAVEIFTP